MRRKVVDETERPELLRNDLRLILRVVCPDVDAEVDADAFEERFGNRDETRLNGDLHVLQAAQRLQQFRNLFLDIGRLVDNERLAQRIELDGAVAAHAGPGLRLDGVGDQVDKRVFQAGAGVVLGGDARRGRAASRNAGHLAHAHVFAAAHGVEALVGRHAVDLEIGLPALAHGGLHHIVGRGAVAIWYGRHQVDNRVNVHHQLALGMILRRNIEHLVLDHIGQVNLV